MQNKIEWDVQDSGLKEIELVCLVSLSYQKKQAHRSCLQSGLS